MNPPSQITMPDRLPAPSKARPIKLRAGLTLERGFTQIARNCLKQIRANEAGLVASSDAEFVHQLRVGLRRLRSALSLFKPWITLAPALAQEIAWLGESLGAARDAEVLAGTTLPALGLSGLEQEGMIDLRKAAASLAQRRRRMAVMALNSKRYRDLIAGLDHWLKTRAWRVDSPCPELLGASLDTAAKQMLKRRRKKLQKQLQALPQPAGPEDRHRLRITVKKLRYAREFFRSFRPPSDAAGPNLAALQELLGQLNDAEVAHKLLLGLGRARPALDKPATFVRGVLWARSQQLIEALEPLLQAFRPDSAAA